MSIMHRLFGVTYKQTYADRAVCNEVVLNAVRLCGCRI